ncbi:MAG: SRPBCC domain-containing protein [Parvularculaceae bacterium]|nr:SRPBCC domain-containing protein [Parvularculaceae bacterium]
MTDKKYADRQIYRVLIDAPIETVWSELVKRTAPRPFFWDSSWDTPDMTPGQPYRMLAKDDKTVAVIGEFLELQPPHLLSHTFRLTSNDDAPSKVTYTLKETPDGVEFCLITENIVAGSKSEKSMDQGAKFIVGNFKAYVETGRVTFAARMQLALFAVMAPMAPKFMHKDNWPLTGKDA